VRAAFACRHPKWSGYTPELLVRIDIDLEALMAQIDGYVTVYESSDGGTGEAEETLWQFFVDSDPASPGDRVNVTTENFRIAETIRLALDKSQKVKVTYDDGNQNRISQARIEFKTDST
jgi:hypothetical protein